MRDISTNRIEVIDVLRGFTLLGIAWVHFTEQFLAGTPPESHASYNSVGLLDNITNGFVGIFVAGKFFMIFSFLFGLSFYLQMESKPGGHTLTRFAWRLVLLFGIGFVHHIHYRGDILTIYAVLGFALLLAQRLPDRIVFVVSLMLIFNLPSVVMRLVEQFQLPADGTAAVNPFTGEGDADNQRYWDAVTSGNYRALVMANVQQFIPKFLFQVGSGRLYITLGLFLLGLLAGRRHVFLELENNIRQFKKFIRLSLWMLLGTILLALIFFGGAHVMGITLPTYVQWSVGGLAYDGFNASLALLYLSSLVLLFLKPRWQPRLHAFYEVGRMGLTTYLTQTLIGFFIFFGLGLNLLGQVGATAGLVTGTVLFVLQIFLSKWWLSRYQYGPVEWFWRSLTYWRWQPFRKS